MKPFGRRVSLLPSIKHLISWTRVRAFPVIPEPNTLNVYLERKLKDKVNAGDLMQESLPVNKPCKHGECVQKPSSPCVCLRVS